MPTSISPDGPVPGDPARRRILGARVDDVTWPEALARIDAFVASGRPHHVVTPNPELVMLARRDPAFHVVLEHADLAPADGVGLRWAGKLLGQPIRAVVPGSDLLERMAEPAGRRGDRWFLLGAAEGVAAEVGRILAARHPGLVIAGTWSGTPLDADADAICRRIEAAAPVDALFVAFGSPAQELWIARHQPRLRVPVAVGVGGGFNFVAGRSRRPPTVVRRLHAIWLFRLLTEPWRWRRQLRLVGFGCAVVREALGRWFGGNPAAARPAPGAG